MCLLFSRGGTRESINYSCMPDKQGDQKFDHSCPQGPSFCKKVNI